MLYRLLASVTVLLHTAFIVFVVLGALLVLRWPRLAWVQIPCALWGGWIEFSGRICPLTPLENHFRRLAGESGYSGGFIEHYLLPLIYPEGLTRPIQLGIGTAVIAINLGAYTLLWRRSRRSPSDAEPP